MRFLAQLAVAVAALLSYSTSWAWGAEGHRMVGYIADAELSPKARIAVRRLMGDDSLASVANWMDDVRPTPEGRAMQRWHYVTKKVCGTGEPSCKNGNCVTEKIEWARSELRSGDQMLALRVLVHLVGDVHQPLHAADNGDFGGNGVTVSNRTCREFGSPEPSACKLHTYWDTNLVKAALRGSSEAKAAQSWASAVGALPSTDPRDPASWADESFALAMTTTYAFDGFACKKGKQAFEATASYDAAGVEVVRQRIAIAGKRLARELNAAFE
jgi:hypothetical protein